jgi:hypothetical protein
MANSSLSLILHPQAILQPLSNSVIAISFHLSMNHGSIMVSFLPQDVVIENPRHGTIWAEWRYCVGGAAHRMDER